MNGNDKKKVRGLIHHIEMYVSNLENSVQFWGWLLERLGYSQYQQWEQGVSWKLEDTYLVFVQAEKRFLDIPYHRCRTGLNHLAFHVESKEQIDILTNELEVKGINILYHDKHPFAGGSTHYAVYFEDPDRIKIEVVAPSE